MRTKAQRKTIGDIGHGTPLGITLHVGPAASGAVALRRSRIAPTGIKPVLRTRKLVATDAGWSVGTGATLERTAQQHLVFLFGREKGPLTP